MNEPTSFWDEPFEWLAKAATNLWEFVTEDPVRDLQAAARDTVTFLEDWLSSFTVGDWVLVGLAGVAVYWVAATLRSLTSLGPIEVEALDHDADPKAAVVALTAALREQLAHTGLSPPPAVPAGTPQVNLIAAVEASSIPQSAWLAKVLQLLPKPPKPAEYKISGVLTGVEPAPDVSFPPPCGMSFWIRPTAAGKDLLKSVNGCLTHDDAIEAAALEIYRHISVDAVDAFPLWARWRDFKALKAYREGCELLSRDDFDGAEVMFAAANQREAHNALGALQVANMRERITAQPPSGVDECDQPRECARAHADVLGRYLGIADEWPHLVAARYRASVVAARLATELSRLSTRDAAVVLNALGDEIRSDAPAWIVEPRVTTVVQRLRGLAARESKAVLQLLRPWYALIHEHRLRTQFEPKAAERRRLGHTVSISKHCVRLRKICGRRDPVTRLEVRYRSISVHRLHLWLGRQGIDWQGRYNAASFDALLLEHLRDQPGDEASNRWWPPRWPVLLKARRRRIRVRALRNLRTAIRESAGDLSTHWVTTDPDFDELRSEWDRILPDGDDEDAGTWVPLTADEERTRALPVPARPWGSPGRRARRVIIVAVATALLLLWLEGPVPGAWLLVIVIAAIAVWRLVVIGWEAQIDTPDELLPPPAGGGPRPTDVVLREL